MTQRKRLLPKEIEQTIPAHKRRFDRAIRTNQFGAHRWVKDESLVSVSVIWGDAVIVMFCRIIKRLIKADKIRFQGIAVTKDGIDSSIETVKKTLLEKYGDMLFFADQAENLLIEVLYTFMQENLPLVPNRKPGVTPPPLPRRVRTLPEHQRHQ